MAFLAFNDLAWQVPADVVEDALSTLGTEFRTKTVCGMRIVIRADMAPSASASP